MQRGRRVKDVRLDMQNRLGQFRRARRPDVDLARDMARIISACPDGWPDSEPEATIKALLPTHAGRGRSAVDEAKIQVLLLAFGDTSGEREDNRRRRIIEGQRRIVDALLMALEEERRKLVAREIDEPTLDRLAILLSANFSAVRDPAQQERLIEILDGLVNVHFEYRDPFIVDLVRVYDRMQLRMLAL